MMRKNLFKSILIISLIAALLTSAACGNKPSDNIATQKNSHADEAVQIIEAVEDDKDSLEMEESSLLYVTAEEEKSEADVTEQEESGERKEIESEWTELKVWEDTESEQEVSEIHDDTESEVPDKQGDIEVSEKHENTESEVSERQENTESETSYIKEQVISDSPYGNEIYMANGVMQYGENASKAQMGKDVNTGSDVDCPYPMEVMTTRVMYNGHFGYHTYRGYYKASNKTENIDCLSDASMSPLFNIDTVMFQGVMGRYSCGYVVFTCLGILD